MQKLKIFFSLNNHMKWLLIEAYFYLAWARILKAKRFSKVAPSLGEKMKETSLNLDDPKHRKLLAEISQAIYIVSKYTFWESQCLVKAIAAMKMLKKRKLDSTLYLGMAKDESGDLIAHAWLRSGPYYVTGAEEKERFTIVSKFANDA